MNEIIYKHTYIYICNHLAIVSKIYLKNIVKQRMKENKRDKSCLFCSSSSNIK